MEQCRPHYHDEKDFIPNLLPRLVLHDGSCPILAIPLQLHPSRECIKSLLTRDAPAADYSLIDGESPSRRRSSSQGDDDPP